MTHKMPRTHGHKTQRITPIDTEESANSAPCNSLQQSFAVELSALIVASLRTKLQEQNLPATGNKAALIEHLTQSSNNNPATAHANPNPQQECFNSTANVVKPFQRKIYQGTLQMLLLLLFTLQTHQQQTTSGAGQALIDNQPSEASELQHSIIRELPADITDILPPDLNLTLSM